MFIEDLVTFIDLLKNQGQARYYSPDDIMLAFNRSQQDLFRSYFKLYEDTREISDSLNPFKKDQKITVIASENQLPPDYAHLTNFSVTIGNQEYPGNIVTDALWNVRELSVLQQEYGDNVEWFTVSDTIQMTNGVGNLPDGYVQWIDVDTGEAEVDITNPQKFVTRKNDKTYPPQVDYPIGCIESGIIKVEPKLIPEVEIYYYKYPIKTRPICRVRGDRLLAKPTDGIDALNITYLINPPDAVYAYTVINGRDYLFDEANSTDTLFAPLDQSELVLKTLQYLGVPLKDDILLKFDDLKRDVKPEQNG